MTDREMLERAAKAAGISLSGYIWKLGSYYWDDSTFTRKWNPLTDDGDALRLAVQLEIDLQHNWGSVIAIYARGKDVREGIPSHYIPEDDYLERIAAARRAIVRAAAEIGKTK